VCCGGKDEQCYAGGTTCSTLGREMGEVSMRWPCKRGSKWPAVLKSLPLNYICCFSFFLDTFVHRHTICLNT
jgi:hypothetical protein